MMYGSDAMAGVVILHPQPMPDEGIVRANVSTEYQTNNGLFGYNLSMGGNRQGFVWDARYSQKMAHEYKNKYDDYLLNRAYQNHLSRLKYADPNVITGRRGVYNMGRNVTFKVVIPLQL